MTRPKGALNRRHQTRRFELAEKLRIRLALGGTPPGLKEMARAAGVTVSTLKYYFGDRDGVVAAVFHEHSVLGDPHYKNLATPGQHFAASIQEAAEYICLGLSMPMVAELHTIGLKEGLGHSTNGPIYLKTLLESLLAALESRLSTHISAGEMLDVDPRNAALSLVSPLLLAHLHQNSLGGKKIRKLDLAKHCSQQALAFVRAFSVK